MIGVEALELIVIRVLEMPQSLVGGDQAFHAPPAIAIRRDGTTHEHRLQYVQKLARNVVICLIAGVMKRDQDLVRQATAVE